MEFAETTVFTRLINELLDAESYRFLQFELAADPGRGDLMRGTGGLRKIRWAASGQGKRGGARVIYYWAVSQNIILMLYAYPKNVQDDLTLAQRKALARIVKEEYP